MQNEPSGTTIGCSSSDEERRAVPQVRRAAALLRDVAQEHRWVLLLAGSYIASGGALLTSLDRAWPIHVTTWRFAALWLVASAAWIAWQYLRSPRLFRAALDPRRVAGAVCLALLAVPFQVTFQALKQSIGHVRGFSWDQHLSTLDIALHGGVAWRWFRPLLESPLATRVVDATYFSWFAVLFGFLMWLCWTRHRTVRGRAILALALLWIFGGTVAAWLAASAGPCYYTSVAGLPDPYQELVRRLDDIGAGSTAPLVARVNQVGLWRMWQQDQWGAFGGISAMPSLHVGLVVLVALVAWQLGVIPGLLLSLYALCIQLGSVLLAWHYAVDGYAGGLIAWASWALGGRLQGPISQSLWTPMDGSQAVRAQREKRARGRP